MPPLPMAAGAPSSCSARNDVARNGGKPSAFPHTVTIRVLFVMALTRHYAVFYLFRRLFFQDEKATNGDGSIVFAPFLSLASNTALRAQRCRRLFL